MLKFRIDPHPLQSRDPRRVLVHNNIQLSLESVRNEFNVLIGKRKQDRAPTIFLDRLVLFDFYDCTLFLFP